MKSVLAGDLGGTKCRVAVVTEDNQIFGAQKLATSRDRAVFLPALEQAFAAALAQCPREVEAPSGIGIGTAGVITVDGRGIERAPNLPLDDFALAAHLEAKFSLPTFLLNDGRASAFGEFRTGSAKGLDPLLCLFFGTGIGIGIIAGGTPHLGADNAAGEIGHTIWQTAAGGVHAAGSVTSRPIAAVEPSSNAPSRCSEQGQAASPGPQLRSRPCGIRAPTRFSKMQRSRPRSAPPTRARCGTRALSSSAAASSRAGRNSQAASKATSAPSAPPRSPATSSSTAVKVVPTRS
ncbi:MAG: ROK family protein [Planctomycetota bacterium]